MPNRLRHSGFTLIELMVTVAVLAILLSIGIPSFAEIMRNNQVAAQTNNLVTALNTARSEASKRGLPVTACAANAALTACSGNAADWTNGWLIFTDATGAGAVDGTDEILQRSGALQNQLRITSAVAFTRFSASGARTNEPGTMEVSLDVKHTQCTGENLRKVEINNTGRVSLRKVACS